jgi:hypothetical protein
MWSPLATVSWSHRVCAVRKIPHDSAICPDCYYLGEVDHPATNADPHGLDHASCVQDLPDLVEALSGPIRGHSRVRRQSPCRSCRRQPFGAQSAVKASSWLVFRSLRVRLTVVCHRGIRYSCDEFKLALHVASQGELARHISSINWWERGIMTALINQAEHRYLCACDAGRKRSSAWHRYWEHSAHTSERRNMRSGQSHRSSRHVSAPSSRPLQLHPVAPN